MLPVPQPFAVGISDPWTRRLYPSYSAFRTVPIRTNGAEGLTTYRNVAVPKRIDKAFKSWEYVPQSLLTKRALEKQGSCRDWRLARYFTAPRRAHPEALGRRTRRRLIHHHHTAVNLVSRHSWPVARKYTSTSDGRRPVTLLTIWRPWTRWN